MIAHADCLPEAELPRVAYGEHFHEFSLYGWRRNHLYEDPSRILVNRFVVGDVEYVSNQSLDAIYEPPIGGFQARFVVFELQKLGGLMEGIDFIGRGGSIKDAQRDWQYQIDTAIQRLFAMQDFERTPEEEKLWRGLGRYFDLNTIRYSTPLKIRSYGVLESIRGHRYKVRWIDTGKTTCFNRSQIPTEMVAFRIGQPFEAVVLRNARDWKMIRIESVFAAKSLPVATKEEAAMLLDPVDRSSLPTAEWD